MSEKKKIVYVSNSSQYGGMEWHLYDLVKGLSKNYEITVICPKGPLVKEYKKEGAKVVIDSPLVDIDPFYLQRLLKYFKEIRPDVLHVHQLKTGVNALVAGFLARVPVRIAHVHTPISTWKIDDFKKNINLFIYRNAVNLLSHFEIALTDSIKHQKVKEGIKRKKLYVISNGVDYEKYQIEASKESIRKSYDIDKNTFLMGTIGTRLSQEKDHKSVIKALYELDEKMDNWHLIIGSSGPMEGELKDLVKKLNLTGKVSFIGRFAEKEKPLLLKALDLSIFPTLAEGFGIVLVETMSAGIPCIASDLKVLKEVGADTVVYYKNLDHKDLARKILAFHQDGDLRKRHGAMGKRRVKNNFTLEIFWKNYSDLYQKMLN